MSTMRAVYTNLRAARTAIKDMSRVRQIAAVLVRHGLGHVVEAFNFQDKFILGLLVEKRPEDAEPRTFYERIAEALQDLGPTFVKMGQILSTRGDLIPQALCDQLKQLQDAVSPITAAEARAVLEKSLGDTIENVFERFDDAHLASASIAQVHTARLKTGEEVVIKIQRPGIAETITADLHILYWLARQVENAVPEAQAFNPVAIAREFEKAISKELDFNVELHNAQRFEKNFAEWDQVHVPRMYPALSTRTVLVMERLYGVKITEAHQKGHNMDAIARLCVRMVCKQLFDDGFFHGDLHPGNLFVLEDGRVGLIDFGLVGRMTPVMKDVMADLFLHLITRNYQGVARSLYDLSMRTGKVDYPAFEADVCELADKNFGTSSLADVDFGEVLRDIIEGAIRHNVRIPPDYTMFFKSIMTVEGIGKIVSPDLDLLEECRPYVEALVAQRYSPDRLLRATVDTMQSFARLSRQFPITAHQFLEQIEDGKLALGLDRNQLEQIESGRNRRTNRAILAAGAATLFICGTLLRPAQGLEPLSLGSLCYVAGFYTGFRLWWRIRGENW
jgi:ubiquinone biosynthesis protein